MDNTEVKTASKKRVYISLPKKYMAAFAENYELVNNFSHSYIYIF